MDIVFRGKTRREWLGDVNDDTVQYMVVLMEMLHTFSNEVFVGLSEDKLYVYCESELVLDLIKETVNLTGLRGYTIVDRKEDMPTNMSKLVWGTTAIE